MSKTLKNIIFGIICLLISYWIYNGLQNNNNEVINISERNDNSDLIFQLLKKEVSLVYDSINLSIIFLIPILLTLSIFLKTKKLTKLLLMKFYLFYF